MDDVVAVEVELDTGSRRYFLTWGRIQARVDGAPLADLVLHHSKGFDLGGEPVRARVCETLTVAADSAHAPYFYECLLRFTAPIPFGDGYPLWCAERAVNMSAGRELAYCGTPDPTRQT